MVYITREQIGRIAARMIVEMWDAVELEVESDGTANVLYCSDDGSRTRLAIARDGQES